MLNKHRLLGFAMGVIAVCPAMAQDTGDATSGGGSVATSYVGDNYRIGIGYDTETDVTGEFFWVFGERPDLAWIAEGWLGEAGAGGVKLDYHWLNDGVQDGVDAAGNPVYSDGKVRKLFLAADRNSFNDGKLSAGFGSERNNRFWSVYGSKSITGERHLGQTLLRQDQTITGIINNHAFSRTDTLETITDFFAHPYDGGVGFRIGRYFDASLLRLRGGLDYEFGDYDSSQLTAFAGVEKRFADSAHGVALRAEALRKSGDFEIDRDDFRVTAFWTFELGTSFAPVSAYRNVQVERPPDPDSLPRKEVVEMVQNRVTLDNASSFDLDSAELNPAALDALRQVVGSLSGTRITGDILIVGHTCSLGSDVYNQALSERRAQAVHDYLAGQGVDAGRLKWEGHGETEPRYSNDTEDSRKLNRRVEITFMAESEVVRQVPVGADEPIKEWVQEKVPVEAAWIRRALRNPVMHKRSVDYYRINRVTENLLIGDEAIANSGPAAANDVFAVDRNSSNNALAVLLNDTDPEGDTLIITSISSPSHGTASISGDRVNYTPEADYLGPDSFSYVVDDGHGGSAGATVNIVVQRPNAAPLAVDDQHTVERNSANNSLDVLANDDDPDGDSFTIVAVTTPAHGTVAISGSLLSYTPAPGYSGPDVFQYTIEDSGGLPATAMVSITVLEANEPPLAIDDFALTRKNQSVVIDILANDSDPDGDLLTVVEILQATHKLGTVLINADGTVTYEPTPGWWGGDSFQYRISDGRGGTALATVVLRVISK